MCREDWRLSSEKEKDSLCDETAKNDMLGCDDVGRERRDMRGERGVKLREMERSSALPHRGQQLGSQHIPRGVIWEFKIL